MAGLALKDMPHDVAGIVREVAGYLGVKPEYLLVYDHNHEGLREGAYSIAWEGDCDWPLGFSEAVYAGNRRVPMGWHLEAGSGWLLACYPAD